MKRFLTLILLVFAVLYALSGCGSAGDVIDYGLVFVNGSDSTIVEVVVDFADRTSGSRRADSCPLNSGETLGFEAGEYPAEVAVYDSLFEGGQKAVGRITIAEAPPDGERWYVTARDEGSGLTLTVDTRWPEGV